MNKLYETLNWRCDWTCEKWSSDAVNFVADKLGIHPNKVGSDLLMAHVGDPDVDTVFIPNNVLATVGITVMLNRLTGVSLTGNNVPYDATNARMIVGTGAGAPAAANTFATFTSPVAVTVKTAPTVSTNTATFAADFTNAVANQAWNEWGIDNGATANQLLNRRNDSLGTKASGTWTLTAVVTIT